MAFAQIPDVAKDLIQDSDGKIHSYNINKCETPLWSYEPAPQAKPILAKNIKTVPLDLIAGVNKQVKSIKEGHKFNLALFLFMNELRALRDDQGLVRFLKAETLEAVEKIAPSTIFADVKQVIGLSGKIEKYVFITPGFDGVLSSI